MGVAPIRVMQHALRVLPDKKRAECPAETGYRMLFSRHSFSARVDIRSTQHAL